MAPGDKAPERSRTIGFCIYCGTKIYDPKNPRRRLGDEHIVPLSLGGRLTLKEASCKACEAITCTFEGTVARTLFGKLRIKTGLPTRNRRSRPDKLPLKVQRFDGVVEKRMVRVSKHPLMLLLPWVTDPPPALGGELRRRDHLLVNFPAGQKETDEQCARLAAELGVARIMLESTLVEVDLILAKIAHCFAVFEYGTDGWTPLLRNLILSKDVRELQNLIGASSTLDSRSDDLHELEIRVVKRKGSLDLLVVEVALFHQLNLPRFDVIVGFIDDAPQIGIPSKIVNDN